MTPVPATDNTSKQQTRFFDGDVLFSLLFALLLVFHLSMNLWWLGADNHTVRTDEEVHMEITRNYYQVMFLNNYENIFQRAIAVTQIKPSYPVHPPLLHICGACVTAIFGYGIDSMALTNTFSFMLLLVGVFLIVRQFLDQWSALFTVFVVSFTPSVYADSRYMMTDYLAATLVIWAVYALLKTDRFRNTEWVFIFAVINGLAILTRTVAFLYYLLPSMLVVAAGAWLLLQNKPDKKYPGFGWQRLVFHCVLTVVITVGVFGPWYLHNLEYYYNYWMEQRSGVVRQIVPGDESPQVHEVAQAPIASQAPAPNTIETGAAPASVPTKVGKGFIDRVLYPRVEWSRYIVLVINNSIFLPLFCLALFGMLFVLCMRRYRSLASLVLIAWVLGSYVLMTQLFHFANPRYALAAVPALSIFASLCVLAPSSLRLRGMCMGALAVYLVYAYGNLTIKDYGPYQRLEAPVTINPGTLKQFDDTGLVIYKAQLPQSFSFSVVGPPTQLNFKDRIFMAMLKEEAKHKELRGVYANYLKLNTRGMEFDEQHYWPDSPFMRKDLPTELFPRRKFKFIGLGYDPEQLLQGIDNAEYIVYTIDVGKEEQELQWQQFFLERDFKLIERFRMDRAGAMAAVYIGVLAYKHVGETIQLGSPEDIMTLDIFDLYRVRYSEKFAVLTPPLQQLVQDRFYALVHTPPFGMNVSLCEEASLMGFEIKREESGAYVFQMLFRVNQAFGENMELYLQAKPDADHVGVLNSDESTLGYKEWKFEPLPQCTAWPAGEYVMVSHQIEAPPGTYTFNVGFQSKTAGIHGQAAELGSISLGASE